jgi:hypothetical protein
MSLLFDDFRHALRPLLARPSFFITPVRTLMPSTGAVATNNVLVRSWLALVSPDASLGWRVLSPRPIVAPRHRGYAP